MSSDKIISQQTLLRSGYHDQVHQLYDEHHGWLYSCLYKKLGSPEQAADLGQDTFVKLLKKQSPSELRTSRADLTTIANSLLIYPVIFAKKCSLNQSWIDQLLLATAAFSFLPLLNYLTMDKYLASSLVQQDWALVGFDLSMLVLGLYFGYAAKKVHNKKFVTSKKTNVNIVLQADSTNRQMSKA